jgi:hypothetical protein
MQEQVIVQDQRGKDEIFAGNIYIFHAFDVGDDINLEAIKNSNVLEQESSSPSKYFKNYHIPLTVKLPNTTDSHCIGIRIHNFGAISLTYKIPFCATLSHIRTELDELDNRFQEQSIKDVSTIFKKIKPFIKKSNFFSTQSSYLVIQVDPKKELSDTVLFKQHFGALIASMLRFETESLSEIQRDEILESSMGYYRGDLLVIDTSAAFVYDSEYHETLDFFEFANIQHLELQYFDRVLDQLLNAIYEEKVRKLSLKAYIPFIGTLSRSPVDELGKLRADISVITERLESSIKLVAEPYFSELYSLLQDKLDLKNWQEGIEKKLSIVTDIRAVFQHKVDAAREDILSVLIAILIMIELVVAILK